MKGVVFTEFLELVEEKFGLKMVDEIIEKSKLTSKGVYTSVGTYPSSEMFQLIEALSEKTKISKDDLLLIYAEHFFSYIEENHSIFLKRYSNPIDLLASIENHIHIEVLKIYPNAELPSFEVVEQTKDSIIFLYKSSRAMHYFAMGLIKKTFEHFNSKANIVYKKIKKDGTEVKFTVTTIHESR
ncbi:heme NO-binding domain-containing protein [Yeosuana sp. AK3]